MKSYSCVMCHGASVWSESKESNGDDAPHGGRAPQINTISINEKIIPTKVGLLNLAEELGNVSKAYQMIGLSRDTFYRYKNAMEAGGMEATLVMNRRVPNRKNRVDVRIEKPVCEMANENPVLGQARVSNELRKRGLCILP